MDVVSELNTMLANLQVFRQKTQACHWALRGSDFFTLHPFTGTLYDDAVSFIDKIAERVRQLDEFPLMTLKAVLDESEFDEFDPSDASQKTMASKILEDLDTLVESSNSMAIDADKEGDRVTAMLLDDLSTTFGKNLWMLKSYLKA